MSTCFEGIGSTWLIPMALLTIFFSLQFPFAWADGMMTPRQMMNPHRAHPQGIKKGIPLTGHGSTWTCLFALNPILSLFIAEYWNQWTGTEHLIAHTLGYGFSGLMHWKYRQAPYPEAHMRDGKLKPAGYVHMLYFGEAVSTLILIYSFTDGIPPGLLLVLTHYMVGHIWLGNHFVNRINRPEWFPDDYAFASLDAWIPVLFIVIILCSGTWFNLNQRSIKSRFDATFGSNTPYVVVYMMK